MRVLIFGGNGMLGHKLVQTMSGRFDVWSTLRKNHEDYQKYGVFDVERIIGNTEIENIDGVKRAFDKSKPDVVINAIGIVKQNATSKEVIKTLNINSIFPHRLSQIAKASNIRLITISTDCVFSGKKGNYTQNDISDAEDLYGKSKNLGEITAPGCLTLRTSIIGREIQTSHSLVEWFLSNRGGSVQGFTKAIFSGFPTVVLAALISEIVEKHKDLQGLFHVSGDPINKYDLLCLLREYYRVPIEITPDCNFVIDRSLDSTEFRKQTGFKPQSWANMIEQMVKDPTPYDNFR